MLPALQVVHRDARELFALRQSLPRFPDVPLHDDSPKRMSAAIRKAGMMRVYSLHLRASRVDDEVPEVLNQWIDHWQKVFSHGTDQITLVDALANGCQSPMRKSAIIVDVGKIPASLGSINDAELIPSYVSTHSSWGRIASNQRGERGPCGVGFTHIFQSRSDGM